MEKLISAEALKKTIKDQWILPIKWEYDAINECIDEMDAADAAPVRHGHWVLLEERDKFTGIFQCSECKRGDEHSFRVKVPFCWYCGALMDGRYGNSDGKHERI